METGNESTVYIRICTINLVHERKNINKIYVPDIMKRRYIIYRVLRGYH